MSFCMEATGALNRKSGSIGRHESGLISFISFFPVQTPGSRGGAPIGRAGMGGAFLTPGCAHFIRLPGANACPAMRSMQKRALRATLRANHDFLCFLISIVRFPVQWHRDFTGNERRQTSGQD